MPQLHHPGAELLHNDLNAALPGRNTFLAKHCDMQLPHFILHGKFLTIPVSTDGLQFHTVSDKVYIFRQESANAFRQE